MSDSCPHCVRIGGVPDERVWLHPAGLPHYFGHLEVVYDHDRVFFEHGSPMVYGGNYNSERLDVFRPHLRLSVVRLKRLMQLRRMTKCRVVRANVGDDRWLYG